MKALFACLATIAVIEISEALDDGLKVKFGMGTTPEEGTEYFYNVPRNISDAKKDGWCITRRPSGPMAELVMYCPSGNAVCALYDDIGDVAGLQIAFERTSVSNNVFDWETRGFRLWNTAIDGQCRTMWATQQYFVSPESLKRCKKERLASRYPTRLLKENAVWVSGNYGELLRISSSESDIMDQNLFTKQGCIPWMGQHFYYNMSRTTPCDAENMYPWFPMTMDNELIAIGFITFGSLPASTSGRNWFEKPDLDVVKRIVPRGPECIYDLVETVGAITMHIYYTTTPWQITC